VNGIIYFICKLDVLLNGSVMWTIRLSVAELYYFIHEQCDLMHIIAAS
jgi:hypothetical protein